MTRTNPYPGAARVSSLGGTTRAEHASDDERPFSEIRKNLQDVLRMVSLHRWAFFIPMCIVMSGAFLLSLYYPRTYSATTSFEQQNDPILADLPMSQGAATFKLFRTTIAQDLTSIACMSEVVDKLNLANDLERGPDGALTKKGERQKASLAASLASRISISTQTPNDHVDKIKITYTGPDPHIGNKLLDELKATYIHRTMSWIQKQLEGLRDYYEIETDTTLVALRDAERDQTRLRLEHPYINPQNPESITTRLSQLEMSREEWKRRRREYTANLDAQRQVLASIEAQLEAHMNQSGAGDFAEHAPYVSADTRRINQKIEDIESEMNRLRATRGMTDAHPDMQAQMAKRQALRSELEIQRSRDLDAVERGLVDATTINALALATGTASPLQSDRARVLVQLSAEEAKIKECEINIESTQKMIDRLETAKGTIFELQEEHANVSAEVTKARRNHANMAGILAKIEPALRVNQQDKLLHWAPGPPASGAATPINPKSRTVILLALIAGAAVGVIFVVLAEILDHVYRNSSQVARSLGLPLLEAIDEIVTAKDRRRLLIHRTVATPMILLLCLGAVGLTGSMAYLSIERPATYERIQRIPRSAIDLIADKAGAEVIRLADASDNS